MSTATPPRDQTVADLLKQLGGVSAARVRMVPTPGTATEEDVTDIHDREGRLFELVDGVLVEKGMGYDESKIAMWLGVYLGNFILQHDLGDILGADGMMRLFPGLVRIPDVAFVSWARSPKPDRKHRAIPDVVPDLVVEVLSKSNTRKEMERKLDEYFRAGVRLVWYVDPKARAVRVYTARREFATLTTEDELDGGAVLPGFRLKLRDLFGELDRQK
jgi:Uma2 family endonuclease